ncbi:MAG: DegT/DnrJ/EryC1/StrS aminotransferase family protein [Gemmatimonadetes bacterium]|nr:DegT/DnrJ/EryC1/StrS aminotransferase family protein [Gemmatimonadota bacterium]
MRRQLPVYSPLDAGAIASATIAAVRGGDRERTALQQELGVRFEAERVILTGSGTQALQLALSHLPPPGPGGTVVGLPAYSCYDLVTAAVGAEVRVRFYDIDPVSLTPDMESVREVLRAGASAVVAGNLHGFPLNWGELRSACEAAGVVLIEDAAQGVGTATDEGPGGTLGEVTVLSFGRGKGWTGGGGGALLLRRGAVGRMADARLAEATRSVGTRHSVVTTAAWTLGRPTLYGLPAAIPGLGLGETRYRDPVRPGPISFFSAALARRTASSAAAAVAHRRHRARRLAEHLGASNANDVGDDRGFVVCEPLGGADAASFLRLPVVFENAGGAAAFARMAQGLGAALSYPLPLHRLGPAQPIQMDGVQKLTGSERLASSLVTLPTHEFVTAEEEESITTLLARNPSGWRSTS